MLRTQVQFTEEQRRRLRAVAFQEGVSVAELVRRYVEQALPRDPPDLAARYARAAGLIGSCQAPAGVDDLAEAHDRHLAEAFD